MTTPVLGTFCGQTSPPVLDSFGSNVRLVFHSDGNQQDLTGFVVRVTASIEGKLNFLSFSHSLVILIFLRVWRRYRGDGGKYPEPGISKHLRSPPLLHLEDQSSPGQEGHAHL